MMMRTALSRAVACASLLLVGCATQSITPPANTPASAVSRPVFAAFEFEGRIAARDGRDAANGTLKWSHDEQHDEWTLLSPLGQIIARINATPTGATLRTADGKRFEAPDVDTLLPRILGISAPAEHLDAWLQGRAAAGAKVLLLDDIGRPSRIFDDGWTIEYPAYANDEPDALPQRIEAQRDEVRLRIIADQWEALR